MAVPFSRPEYSPSARRRRSSSTHPSRASPLTPRSRGNSSANILASHFATGGRTANLPLGLSLDSLSLTSRITFYALYEAWRLLQEVTGSLSYTPPQQINHHDHVEPSLPESYVEESMEEHQLYIPADETHNGLVKSVNKPLPLDLPYPTLPKRIQQPLDFKKPESKKGSNFEESNSTPRDWKKPSSGSIWIQLGQQICEASSSFEISYNGQESGATRALFESYRDLKHSVMMSDLKKSKSLSSAKGPSLIIFLSYSKTALRQLLLSTLWFLLKKIL